MSGDERHESVPSAELSELVDRLNPRIHGLLARHGIPEEAAGELVYETMVALAHRWHRVRDRERWFLDTLERACARKGTTPAGDPN